MSHRFITPSDPPINVREGMKEGEKERERVCVREVVSVFECV